MNLRDLNYLVAAAETEHFGRAAERCHVSQPTLSGQIKKLEDTLGLILFERSHRAVVLTDAGREIAAHARRILNEVADLESMALSRQDPLTGDLRVGIIPTLCAYLLPHLLPILQQRVPDLHPVLFEETTARLLDRLHKHEIDAALVATIHEEEGLIDQHLFDEPLWVAIPAKHEMSTRKAIDQSDLNNMPLLLLDEGHCLADRVREIFALKAPQGGSADLRATSLETLLQLVSAGQGITLVPRLAVEHSRAAGSGLHFVPLDMPQGHRKIRLIYRRSTSRKPALEALGSAVRESVEAVGFVDQ
ncbi:MAG: LysR substrate-binding domain-containing protein [Granulosicoccus sp.]